MNSSGTRNISQSSCLLKRTAKLLCLIAFVQKNSPSLVPGTLLCSPSTINCYLSVLSLKWKMCALFVAPRKCPQWSVKCSVKSIFRARHLMHSCSFCSEWPEVSHLRSWEHWRLMISGENVHQGDIRSPAEKN